MELVSAARRHALAHEPIRSYVQDSVWKHRLEESLGGGCALVVIRAPGGHAPPLRDGGGSEFPILRLECWADSTRDSDGNMYRRDCEDRAWALYRAAMPAFHTPRRAMWWGAVGTSPGLQVISSYRLREPIMVYADERPDVHDPDIAIVTADFEVHALHGTVD